MRTLSRLPSRVVFMDAGLTLYESATLYDGAAPDEGFIEVPKLSWQRDEPTSVRARPSARAALEQLKARGEFVVVLTGGPTDLTEACLEAIELDGLIEGVLNPGHLRRTGIPQFCVLVEDDADPKEKVAALLGYSGKDDMPDDAYSAGLATLVVRCHKYFWGDDSRPLTAEVDQVVRLLDAQASA